MYACCITKGLLHSYPSCNQHAPDEHLLEAIVEQGLMLAAGIFWNLGEPEGQAFKKATPNT
ncbi:hypothetical protein BV504_06065 [Halomonas sp. 'Soap Lake |nr:hypothetical protein B2G49_06065 [Halomonas sp. 'Soap Lake \